MNCLPFVSIWVHSLILYCGDHVVHRFSFPFGRLLLTVMSNTEILMQCLMDSSKTRVSDILGDHSDIIADIEEISRNLIFDIHNNRAVNI